MSKKILLSIFVLIFAFSSLSGCYYSQEVIEEDVPDPFELFNNAITEDYASDVMDALSGFGNSPRFGFRTSGSEAELAAAEYLYSEMLEIGLTNVVKESLTVDSWEFTKAELIIERALENGETEIRNVDMAAYPTHYECEDEAMQLIYAGKGTEADFENIDAEGKLVLIDIDQMEDWPVSWPSYQAKVKGANAVIAVNTGGYFQYSPDTLGILDIKGAKDAPAFSVTVRDGDMIKGLLAESGVGELAVRLTADSVIREEAEAYAVIGEIPGATDEVIYLIAHYDGFFSGFDDNASGVGAVLGIAKALVDSGFEPQKTIRFILHPAEYCGDVDSGYGFAAGAYRTIENHPDWAADAFALINIDGGVTSNYASGIEVSASYELIGFAREVGFNVEESPFGDFDSVASLSLTGDFPYAQKGIPVLRSGFSGDGEKTGEVSGSNMDTRDYFFYEDAAAFAQKLYGAYIIELDRMMIKPLNYVVLFEELLDAVGTETELGAESLENAVYGAIDASKDLSVKIERGGEWEPDEAKAFNESLWRLAESIQSKLITATQEGGIIFAHERHRANVSAIKAAASALKSGDALGAIDFLSEACFSRYGNYFDETTYRHFADNLPGNADPYEIIGAIKTKLEQGETQDFLAEMESIDIALISQEKLLKDDYSRMTKDVISITKTIDRLAE